MNKLFKLIKENPKPIIGITIITLTTVPLVTYGNKKHKENEQFRLEKLVAEANISENYKPLKEYKNVNELLDKEDEYQFLKVTNDKIESYSNIDVKEYYNKLLTGILQNKINKDDSLTAIVEVKKVYSENKQIKIDCLINDNLKTFTVDNLLDEKIKNARSIKTEDILKLLDTNYVVDLDNQVIGDKNTTYKHIMEILLPLLIPVLITGIYLNAKEEKEKTKVLAKIKKS